MFLFLISRREMYDHDTWRHFHGKLLCACSLVQCEAICLAATAFLKLGFAIRQWSKVHQQIYNTMAEEKKNKIKDLCCPDLKLCGRTECQETNDLKHFCKRAKIPTRQCERLRSSIRIFPHFFFLLNLFKQLNHRHRQNFKTFCYPCCAELM